MATIALGERGISISLPKVFEGRKAQEAQSEAAELRATRTISSMLAYSQVFRPGAQTTFTRARLEQDMNLAELKKAMSPLKLLFVSRREPHRTSEGDMRNWHRVTIVDNPARRDMRYVKQVLYTDVRNEHNNFAHTELDYSPATHTVKMKKLTEKGQMLATVWFHEDGTTSIVANDNINQTHNLRVRFAADGKVIDPLNRKDLPLPRFIGDEIANAA